MGTTRTRFEPTREEHIVYERQYNERSQLGFRVYEELNSNGILRTLWVFFLKFYVHKGIFSTFGGVLLVKISEFLVHLGENFGILR